ncbi:MAG: O-antigen ligase family protein, partial [Thalassobaculaceae bacterium]
MPFPPALRSPSFWLWGVIAVGMLSQLVIGLYSHQAMAPSFVVLAAGVMGLARYRLGRWVGLDPLTVTALAALTGLLLAQPMIAPDCARCAGRAVRVLPLLWLIALTTQAARAVFSAAPAWANRWFGLLTWGGGIVVVLMLIELIANAALYRWATNFSADQAVGPSRYNRAASLLALAVWSWAAWITLRPGRGPYAPFWMAAVLVGLTGVLALGDSTTSLLAFAIGLAAAAAATVAPGWVLLAGIFAQGAVLAAGPWPWAAWPVRLDDSFGHWPVSLWHRFEIWDHGALAVAARPWFGWGFGGYREVPTDLAPTATYRYFNETSTHPHNVFLQLWVELGAGGALAGVLVVLAVARAIWAGPPALRPPAQAEALSFWLAARLPLTAGLRASLLQATCPLRR